MKLVVVVAHARKVKATFAAVQWICMANVENV